MITTIYINESSELESLKKEFRKRLMTGGAVIRLEPGLSVEVINSIEERFRPNSQAYNVASMVLKEIELSRLGN